MDSDQFVLESEPRVDVLGDTHWEDLKNQFVAQAKKCKADVLFMGDDHVALLEQSIIFGKYFVPLHTTCFGVIGDKISNLLWRLGDNLLTDLDLKVIVVSIGNSDYGLTKEQMLEGLKKVAETIRAQKPSIKLLFMELLPTGRWPNERRVFLNEINKEMRVVLEGLAEVIATNPFLLERNGEIDTFNMFDYFHLTQEGYWLVFEPIAHTLNDIINPKTSLFSR